MTGSEAGQQLGNQIRRSSCSASFLRSPLAIVTTGYIMPMESLDDRFGGSGAEL